MEIQWNDSCEGTTDIEEIGERESEVGKTTDLVSCKQKRDLVCAQLRIIRGNPLANTFISLYLSYSSYLFLSIKNPIVPFSTYRDGVQMYSLFYSITRFTFSETTKFQTHQVRRFSLLFREMKQLRLNFFPPESFDPWKSSSVRRPLLFTTTED